MMSSSIIISKSIRQSQINNKSVSTLLHHLCKRNMTTSTTPKQLPMKPGTPIPGLSSIYPPSKDGSTNHVPVALPREEYPAWVNDLATPPPTLAKLRNKLEAISDFDKDVDVKDGEYDTLDKEMKRYLKLVRRGAIKENNSVAAS